MNEKKKIFIIGSSAKEFALVKYFAKQEYVESVFVAPGNKMMEEYAQREDIRETDGATLLEFAIKNDIDMTIISSSNAIREDVASYFRENSQPVFAPTAQSSAFTTSRALAKKSLYRMHAPTPKFGIFDKPQQAEDYVKKENYPLLITTDFNEGNDPLSVCNNYKLAQTCINDITLRDHNKIIIEEFINGHLFTLYAISDGYSALPITVVGDYKFQNDGDGGIFTLGSGAYLPDYKVPLELVNKIMDNVVNNVISYIQSKGTPYLGVIGVECVLKPSGDYSILGFTPFFKDHDTQAILNSLDIDLYKVIEACVNGSFADDYSVIPIKSVSVTSCVLFARNSGSIITGLEMVDDTTDISYFSVDKNSYLELFTNKGRTLVITQTAGTFTRARELMYDNIEDIYFNGISYRRDICAQ